MHVDLIFPFQLFQWLTTASGGTFRKRARIPTWAHPSQARKVQVLHLKDLYILIVENRHDEPTRNKRNKPGTDYKDISMVRGEGQW